MGKVNKARTYSLIPDHTIYDDDAGIICSVSKSTLINIYIKYFEEYWTIFYPVVAFWLFAVLYM